ncbi:MAG: hypothetical protein EBS82_07530, partial [Methylocystaceae bacterium]|nr:hypothetical protein [Methylocystaceae bacterium]
SKKVEQSLFCRTKTGTKRLVLSRTVCLTDTHQLFPSNYCDLVGICEKSLTSAEKKVNITGCDVKKRGRGNDFKSHVCVGRYLSHTIRCARSHLTLASRAPHYITGIK